MPSSPIADAIAKFDAELSKRQTPVSISVGGELFEEFANAGHVIILYTVSGIPGAFPMELRPL